MVRCITKYEMRFGDIVVPARTEGFISNNISATDVNAAGVRLDVVIFNFDMGLSDKENENKVIKYNTNVNKSSLGGICIFTASNAVCMDAENILYKDFKLYKWELERIFGENNVPESLIGKAEKEFGRCVPLDSVIDYMEDEFSKWVARNCDFWVLEEKDIADGYGFDGAVPGDKSLSSSGIEQFERKYEEYNSKLEKIGFTYRFKGGLVWD